MYKIPANTLFIGQRLVFVPECPSTNSLALELSAKSILPEGTVIITSNQTAGRGQRGNTWKTSEGLNLTFSVLLKPSFLKVNMQFYLTIATSLAVQDFLKSRNVDDTRIKWPNDILVGRKKICGMLIENSIQGESIQQSIVGIGLNINQTDFELASATSLATIKQESSDLNQVLNLLLGQLEKRYMQLRAGKLLELKDEYRRNLFGMDEKRTFISNEKKFEGTIANVSESGELIVVINNNRTSFNLKEISLVL